MPTLYDAALDDDWSRADQAAQAAARARCRRLAPSIPAWSSSPSSSSGPARKRGQWVLPPAQLPHPIARSRPINKAEVEARGRTLVESLASHGVETKLLGLTVGPTVTRYELELGLGREGRPGHQPQPRHRLRDGRHRRAHPGADSRAARPSASRCPTTPASWSASATSWRRPRPRRPPIRSTWPSARTSPAARCSSTWPPRRTC